MISMPPPPAPPPAPGSGPVAVPRTKGPPLPPPPPTKVVLGLNPSCRAPCRRTSAEIATVATGAAVPAARSILTEHRNRRRDCSSAVPIRTGRGESGYTILAVTTDTASATITATENSRTRGGVTKCGASRTPVCIYSRQDGRVALAEQPERVGTGDRDGRAGCDVDACECKDIDVARTPHLGPG